MTTQTAACAACPDYVDLTKFHVVVRVSTERLNADDTIDVSDAQVLSTMHLICAESVSIGTTHDVTEAREW